MGALILCMLTWGDIWITCGRHHVQQINKQLGAYNYAYSCAYNQYWNASCITHGTVVAIISLHVLGGHEQD